MLNAAAARMIPQGVGPIVNTASITAFGGGTFSKVVYATAAVGVIGCAAANPRAGSPTSARRRCRPAFRWTGGPALEDPATIDFLLSDGGAYINGATIQSRSDENQSLPAALRPGKVTLRAERRSLAAGNSRNIRNDALGAQS